METQREGEYTLSKIISLLWERALLIGICIVIFTGGSFLISKYVIEKEYTVSVSMYVAPNTSAPETLATLSELNYAKEVVNTYIQILNTNDFRVEVAKASKLKYSSEDLRNMITIQTVNDTEIFQVMVTTNNPKHSLIIAETIAELAPVKIMDIKNADAVKVVDSAVLPKRPSAPNVILNTIIGFLMGAVISVLVVLAMDILNKQIKDEDDITNWYELPVIGTVPRFKNTEKFGYAGKAQINESFILDKDSDFSLTESYRTIRTNLIFAIPKSGCKKIIVTSALPKEGKSATICNLGITLAQAGKKVLIVDCDLRKPTIHKRLHTVSIPGLSDILVGMAEIEEAVRETADSSLKVICAGTFSPDPAELLSSDAMVSLVLSLEKEFDYILFDSPPLNIVSDTMTLAKLMDGVLIVVRAGKTIRPEFQKALSKIKFTEIKVLGVILNDVERDGYRRYDYKYGES